jgi:type II secretory pathway component GspD/PulD (secretin)
MVRSTARFIVVLMALVVPLAAMAAAAGQSPAADNSQAAKTANTDSNNPLTGEKPRLPFQDGYNAAASKPLDAGTTGGRANQEAADRSGGAGTSKTPHLMPDVKNLSHFENGKYIFNFVNTPWKDVINWFAEQSKYVIVSDNKYPPGTFSYKDENAHSPNEALDILNGVLLYGNKWTLVRRGNAIWVVDLDNIPPGILPLIKPNELEGRGDFEMLRVGFDLNTLVPADLEADVKKMLGPQGRLEVFTSTNQMMVTETGHNLREIKAFIDRLKNPSSAIKPEQEPPIVKVYPIQAENPQQLFIALRTLMASQPDVRVDFDPSTRNIVALASQSQHKIIASAIDKMIKDAEIPFITVIPLHVVDPRLAMVAIKALFDTAPPPAFTPQVTINPTGTGLHINSTKAQIDKIRHLLKEMGEKEETESQKTVPGQSKVLIVSPGRNGLMIGSNDLESLDLLEQMLNAFSFVLDNGSEITIFSLKRAKAAVAAQNLDMVIGRSWDPKMVGLILGSNVNASQFTTTAPVNIVPYAKLNSIIVRANSTDKATVERLLLILDREDEPNGPGQRYKIVPLMHADPDDIVDTVRTVYYDRLDQEMGGVNGQGGNQANVPDGNQLGGRDGQTGVKDANKSGNKREIQTFNITSDQRTRSVVIAAPEPLLAEIARFVEVLDQQKKLADRMPEIVPLNSSGPRSELVMPEIYAGNNNTSVKKDEKVRLLPQFKDQQGTQAVREIMKFWRAISDAKIQIVEQPSDVKP